MKDQRTFVTFKANLPDDAVFTATGDVSVPGGRNICENLAQCLRSEGAIVSDPVQHQFYGWEFTAHLDRADIWMILQRTENWLLIIEDQSSKSSWFRAAKAPSVSALNFLNGKINEISSFSNIEWFTRKEYEHGAKIGKQTP